MTAKKGPAASLHCYLLLSWLDYYTFLELWYHSIGNVLDHNYTLSVPKQRAASCIANVAGKLEGH